MPSSSGRTDNQDHQDQLRFCIKRHFLWAIVYSFMLWFAFYVSGNTLQLHVTLYTPFQLLWPNICPSALFQLRGTADHKPVPHSHNGKQLLLALKGDKSAKHKKSFHGSTLLNKPDLGNLESEKLSFWNDIFKLTSSVEGYPLN